MQPYPLALRVVTCSADRPPTTSTDGYGPAMSVSTPRCGTWKLSSMIVAVVLPAAPGSVTSTTIRVCAGITMSRLAWAGVLQVSPTAQLWKPAGALYGCVATKLRFGKIVNDEKSSVKEPAGRLTEKVEKLNTALKLTMVVAGTGTCRNTEPSFGVGCLSPNR